MKHSSGKWECIQAADKSAKYWIRNDHWIGQVGNGTNGKASHARAAENARLITAAPRLLAALELIVNSDHLKYADGAEELVAIGQDAINKATRG